MAFRGQNHDPVPTFPIVDVLVHYGGDPPTRSGGWVPVRCPLHGSDRNPSASVNEQAQRFCCFVCMERSEDAVGLVMLQEQVGFKEAVKLCESITDALDSGPSKPKGQGALRDLF